MQTNQLVIMTSDQLDNLVQTAVMVAIGKQQNRPTIREDKPLSIIEASEFLNIPKATLYQFTSARTIPFQKVGKKILFFRHELIAWIESKRKKTISEIQEEGFSRKGGVK
jgi:excisionase family DNA binding protein